MGKKSFPEIRFFGIFLLILGIIALASAQKLKAQNPANPYVNIQILNTIHQTGKNLIQDFKQSENNQYPQIRNLFFSNISLLRQEIINYKDDLFVQREKRTTLITLFMSLAGLYYIFSFIGTFHKNFKIYPRLKIAMMLWSLTLIATFCSLQISTASLNLLIDRLDILNHYIPTESRTTLLPLSSDSLYNPVLFLILLINMIIYIILPLWYINLSKVKNYLSK